jgi:predicted RNA-binding Zn-ribbon protein involved in translation (DUF1610 family)
MSEHPRDLALGADETQVVRCPDCGQLELWTDQEVRDHGQCRSAAERPCPVCPPRSDPP